MKLLSFAESKPVVWIKLSDGTTILLNALDQYLTYGGLLVGVPDERINSQRVERARSDALARFGDSCNPHVIEPALIPFKVERQTYAVSSAAAAEPRGKVEEVSGQRFPHVTCIARFRCPATIDPERNEGFFSYSMATLVWFQDTFAMPIAPDVLALMRALEWKSVAKDVSD